MTDICCIGHITRDKIITPESTVYMAGGTSFYMSYGMSRLPKTVSYKLVTKVGKGQFPEVEKLRQAGIDVRCYDSRHTVYFETSMVLIPTTVRSVCWPRRIHSPWRR